MHLTLPTYQIITGELDVVNTYTPNQGKSTLGQQQRHHIHAPPTAAKEPLDLGIRKGNLLKHIEAQTCHSTPPFPYRLDKLDKAKTPRRRTTTKPRREKKQPKPP